MNPVPTAYPRASHKAVLAEVQSPERASVRHKSCDGFLTQAPWPPTLWPNTRLRSMPTKPGGGGPHWP